LVGKGNSKQGQGDGSFDERRSTRPLLRDTGFLFGGGGGGDLAPADRRQGEDGGRAKQTSQGGAKKNTATCNTFSKGGGEKGSKLESWVLGREEGEKGGDEPCTKWRKAPQKKPTTVRKERGGTFHHKTKKKRRFRAEGGKKGGSIYSNHATESTKKLLLPRGKRKEPNVGSVGGKETKGW